MNHCGGMIRLVAFSAVILCGCATYHAAPLEPARITRGFDSRSLSNPALCNYLRANLSANRSSCPPERWDVAALTLVGFYYSPDIAVAEARVEQADAAIIAAGARPNPTVSVGPEYSTRAIPNVVPWGLGMFNLNLTIETAGKRGYRIAEAGRLADAAKLQLVETAWKVRSRIRSALLTYLLDIRERNLWEQTVDALAQTTKLLSDRLMAGAASQPELSLAQSLMEDAKVKVAQAAARVPEARNELASALGLPVGALDGASFPSPGLDQPPQNSLSAARVQRLALLNRVDLQVQLARYAAADEAQKLEIAKQYPDINLMGGYAWDGGDNIFDLGPSVMLPIFNQNQGPIAEAKAQRRELAAEFLALQASIIGQARGALEDCRGALNALRAADQAMQLQGKRFGQAQQAFTVGEVDALSLAQNQLQYLVARQTELSALRSAQFSLGALEDVVQRPLESGDVGSFTFPRKSAIATTDRS
jgi:cobalt-zinc-cadmium efflux system outer membrane protein